MHLERIGAWFVAATVLLAIAGNAAVAQEHDIYRCKVADVVTWASQKPMPTVRFLASGPCEVVR
jgi:hypothetical protein